MNVCTVMHELSKVLDLARSPRAHPVQHDAIHPVAHVHFVHVLVHVRHARPPAVWRALPRWETEQFQHAMGVVLDCGSGSFCSFCVPRVSAFVLL